MLEPGFFARHSLYVENLMRHGFLFDLSRHLLLLDKPRMVTVLNAEVDDSGVDMVLTLGAVTRHVQMKTLNKVHAPNPYAIAESLFRLPGGCVIWKCYDPKSLRPICYHLLGNPGNEPLGSPGEFPPALRKKQGAWTLRESYVGVKTREANHKSLDLAALAAVLFEPKLR